MSKNSQKQVYYTLFEKINFKFQDLHLYSKNVYIRIEKRNGTKIYACINTIRFKST